MGKRKEKMCKSIYTPSVNLAEVGEAPHVAQTHCEANAGQQVLCLVVPLGSLLSPLVVLHTFLWHLNSSF